MLCTFLSYIGRSGRQGVKFDLSMNCYGPKDLGFILDHSATSLHP